MNIVRRTGFQLVCKMHYLAIGPSSCHRQLHHFAQYIVSIQTTESDSDRFLPGDWCNSIKCRIKFSGQNLWRMIILYKVYLLLRNFQPHPFLTSYLRGETMISKFLISQTFNQWRYPKTRSHFSQFVVFAFTSWLGIWGHHYSFR